MQLGSRIQVISPIKHTEQQHKDQAFGLYLRDDIENLKRLYLHCVSVGHKNAAKLSSGMISDLEISLMDREYPK